MAADWAKIEAEYITTDTSYRRLAEKYRVDQATIARKAKKEDWVSKRQHHINKTQAKVLAADTQKKVNRAAALNDAADLLLERTVNGIKAYKELPATAAKNYSDALKNLREVLMIRSEEDIEEQKARIAKLQKDAQKDEGYGAEPIRVIIDSCLDEYSR